MDNSKHLINVFNTHHTYLCPEVGCEKRRKTSFFLNFFLRIMKNTFIKSMNDKIHNYSAYTISAVSEFIIIRNEWYLALQNKYIEFVG